MNTRFFNAKILKLDAFDQWVLENGEVWVQGTTITCVGQPEDDRAYVRWDREIDCGGNLLMPGFKNMHTHSAMTFLRSYEDNSPLDVWLEQYIFPMERKLTPELVYWFTVLAIMEYVSGGITTNFDMYFHPEIIAKAAVDTGFRTVQTGALNNFSSSLEEQEQLYHTVNGMGDLVSYQLGFHAEYTTSENLMRGVAALADKLHSPVWFHNAETKKEVDGCVGRYGVTPTVLADRLGLFSYGGGGYHCVHLQPQDREIFAKRGLTAVTNPASNLKLGSGVASVGSWLASGINAAIGTDGAASNNSLDMFREMFLTASLAKLSDGRPDSISAEQVLFMATAAGARGVGLHDCDNLEVGKKADLVMIDLHTPNMQPTTNIIGNLVYSGSKQCVALTMVNGNILYEAGEYHIGVDPQEVYKQTAAILKTIME